MSALNIGRVCACLAVTVVFMTGCGTNLPLASDNRTTDNRTIVVPSTDNNTARPSSVSDNKTAPKTVYSSDNASAAKIGFEIGDLAPDFTLKTPDGRDVKLSDFRGKNVFLHFWDIGCPSCTGEMPLIQQVWQAHQASNDLIVLAVNLGGNAEQVQTFMKGYGYTFSALLDSDRVVNRLYDEPCCPGTYLINKQGIIAGKLEGAFRDAAAIEEAVYRQ